MHLNIVSLDILNAPHSLGSGAFEWDHARFLNEIFPDLAAAIPLLGGSKEIFLKELSNPAFASRNSGHAHLTTSCVVVSPDFSSVLLLFHKKIGEWIYPGGHADGDWFLLRSALRECTEETGLKELYLLERAWGSPLLPFFVQHFQLKPFGSTPAHEHYDAVFAFQALKNEVIYDASESDGIRWVSAASLQQQVDRQCGMNDGISLLTAKLCLKVLQEVKLPPR